MPVETKIIKIVFVVFRFLSCRMCFVGENHVRNSGETSVEQTREIFEKNKCWEKFDKTFFSVFNNLVLKMVRFLVVVFILTICQIDFVFGDLDSLLALSDESNESGELVDFAPVRLVDVSKPVHHLKIDHCTLCSSFKKNAILIARAVMDESPMENFNVTFGMKNGE